MDDTRTEDPEGATTEVQAEAAMVMASKMGQEVVTALDKLVQAVNDWQQAISFANENRRDIQKQTANLVKQMNSKMQSMEKRLEECLEQTSSGRKIEKQGADMQQVAVNQGTSSLQGRPPAEAGTSSGVKRSMPSTADSPYSSATPAKFQRTIQDPTPGTHFMVPNPETSSSVTNPSPSLAPPQSPPLNRDQQLLLSTVKNGRTNYCQAMLKLGVDPNFKDKEGNTLLHLAAKISKNHLAVNILEALLETDALQVDAQDATGQTALHVAASQPNGDRCVNMLLVHCADVNKTDFKGNTPLHCAARNGNKKIMKKLLRNPAIIIVANNEGEKPIDVANDDETRSVFEGFNETSASADERLDPPRLLEIVEDSTNENNLECN